MGQLLLKLKGIDLEPLLEWLETTLINLPLFYIDIAGRWLTNGWVGDVYEYFEIIFNNYFYKTSAIKKILDEEKYYCIDEDGLHFKGETWQSKGKCNIRRCVAHDVIKETGCPEVSEKKGCAYYKENPNRPYPSCCASIHCPVEIVPPLRREAPVHWYRDEGYNHA